MAGRSTIRVKYSGLSEAPAPSMANKKRKASAVHRDQPTAKRKISKLRLIDLPTDILCSVLSKLPFKEALRTSVLSTEWKHVWCGRTKLDFSHGTVLTNSENRDSVNYCPSVNRQKFIKRVTSVLQQHDGIGIEQFRVVHPLNNDHSDDLNKWVNYAIESKAKELILVLTWPAAPPEMLPYDFCFQSFNTNYPYLHSLQLSFVSLRLPSDFTGFPNLTKLNLEDVNVTDEDAQRLLSICNLLVSLRVVACKMLTSLRTRHLNQLRHLHVQACPLVQAIELNCGVMELDYRGGPMIPMALAGSPGLTNICIKLSTKHSAVDFIFGVIPNTLRHLEVLTFRCTHIQGAALPRRTIIFNSVRHLRLEIVLRLSRKKVDMLDLACLLEAAPLMEILELHMVMNRDHERYHVEDGELRRLPSYSHHHLSKVKFTGFYGQKDQLELVLHILRNATMLRDMKIETRPTVEEPGKFFCGSALHYRDGYNVASEFLCKEDSNNAVRIFETSGSFFGNRGRICAS